MRGDTNCAECGSWYRPYEKNANKQRNDNSIATQLKDVFKLIFPSLPKVVQEKLKTSFPGLIQMPEPSGRYLSGLN